MRRVVVGLVVALTAMLGSAPPAGAEDTLTPSRYPIVTGVFAVGKTLHTTTGTWEIDGTETTVDIAIQWYIGDTPVPEGTTRAFTIPRSAAGKTVWVQVTASKDGYTSSTPTTSQMAGSDSDVGLVARRGACLTMKRANRLAHRGSTVPTKVYVVYCGKPWAVADVVVGKGPHGYDALRVFRFVDGHWTAFDRQDVTCPSDNNALWFACNVD
jgi:hypothetical protein